MHMVETMAFNKVETPWHGLGNAVDGNLTVEQMLQAAQLDWTVSRRKVWINKTRDPRDGMIAVPDQVAITRDTDLSVFGIFTEGYKPVQNKEVLGFFRDYLEAGGMTLETAGALKGGAVVWGLAKIGAGFELADDDAVDGYVLVYNSHDGSMCFQGQYTTVRVVCMNTLRMAMEGKNNATGRAFKMRHNMRITPEVIADAKRQMGLATQHLATTQERAELLSNTAALPNSAIVKEYILQLTAPELLAEIVDTQTARVESADDRGVIEMLVEATEQKSRHEKLMETALNRAGKGILDAIVNSPGSELESAQNTWWGVVNGVTHYIDHEAGRSRDTALSSAWFGRGGETKDKAFQLAVQYAEATR